MATVVGGGPTGSLAAMLLKDAGFDVSVFELRDGQESITTGLGKAASATKRSINLALSHRGLEALARVGLAQEVLAHAVEMHSRYVHLKHGTAQQRYGKQGEAIYSVSRETVVSILARAAEQRGVKFRRGEKFVKFDDKGAVFASGATSPFPVLGCDGAFSATRRAAERKGRYETRIWYAKQGYKELSMPSADFPPNYLHIWPRGDVMLIALPNVDRSFTATLFAPHDHLEDMESWDREAVAAYFQREFPDAVPFMPSVVDDFFENPTAPLVQVQINPWHFKDQVLLLGDASHAVVPFYGQGMNAAFEDCLVFAEILHDSKNDVGAAFAAMSDKRRRAADGLSTLATMNYDDMAANTASAWNRLRKRVEAVVATYVPSLWKTQYSMVTFSRMPYDEVLHRHFQQERVLSLLTAGLVAFGLLGALKTTRLLVRRS